MKVYIEVTGWFKRYTENRSFIEMEVPVGTLAYDVVCKTGIPREQIGFVSLLQKDKDGTNKLVGEDYQVYEEDTLKVFPSIIGG